MPLFESKNEEKACNNAFLSRKRINFREKMGVGHRKKSLCPVHRKKNVEGSEIPEIFELSGGTKVILDQKFHIIWIKGTGRASRRSLSARIME
jgi:hypothetical protein